MDQAAGGGGATAAAAVLLLRLFFQVATIATLVGEATAAGRAGAVFVHGLLERLVLRWINELAYLYKDGQFLVRSSLAQSDIEGKCTRTIQGG